MGEPDPDSDQPEGIVPPAAARVPSPVASPARARYGRTAATHAAAIVVGLLVGLGAVVVVNGGPLFVPKGPGPGTATLDGVQIDFFYLNGTPPLFGANQQQGCGNCPLTVPGGTVVTLGSILVLSFPSNYTTTFWFNATSPIPFEEWQCFYSGTSPPPGWPAQGCPFATDWHQGALTVLNGGGELWFTYPLTLSVPNPAPSLVGGFTVQIVITVLASPGLAGLDGGSS